MRKFAVGDIHGCLHLLKKLIDIIQPTNEDTIIFLGDYIDRGPDSKGVIDFLIDLKDKTNCIFLIGNHEDMMLQYLKSYRNKVKKLISILNVN